MSIVWAVPVAAAALAAALIVAWVRAIEEAAFGLWHEVARLSDVRRPLARLRAAADETETVVETFRSRHELDDEAPTGPAPAP